MKWCFYLFWSYILPVYFNDFFDIFHFNFTNNNNNIIKPPLEAHLDCLNKVVGDFFGTRLPFMTWVSSLAVSRAFLILDLALLRHEDSSTSRLKMVYWCRGNDLSLGVMLYRVCNAPCTFYISRCGVKRVAAWEMLSDGFGWVVFRSMRYSFLPEEAFLDFWLFLLSWFVSRYRWFCQELLWRWWLGVWRRFFSWLWSDFSFLFFLIILWDRVRVREASIVMHIHPINMKLVKKLIFWILIRAFIHITWIILIEDLLDASSIWGNRHESLSNIVLKIKIKILNVNWNSINNQEFSLFI